MDINEALDIIRKNWPSANYTMLREALELVMKVCDKCVCRTCNKSCSHYDNGCCKLSSHGECVDRLSQ